MIKNIKGFVNWAFGPVVAAADQLDKMKDTMVLQDRRPKTPPPEPPPARRLISAGGFIPTLNLNTCLMRGEIRSSIDCMLNEDWAKYDKESAAVEILSLRNEVRYLTIKNHDQNQEYSALIDKHEKTIKKQQQSIDLATEKISSYVLTIGRECQHQVNDLEDIHTYYNNYIEELEREHQIHSTHES